MEILHGALMIPEAQAHRAYFYLRDPAFIEKVRTVHTHSLHHMLRRCMRVWSVCKSSHLLIA